MLRLLLLVFTFLASGVAAKEVPIEDFFAHEKFRNVKISPDAKHIAFSYEEGSEVRLAIMELKQQKILSSFGFGDNMHVINFYWANNERILMQVVEQKGNLASMQGSPVDLYAANIDGRRRTLLVSGSQQYIQILHLLPKQPQHILIGRYVRDERTNQGTLRAFTLDVNRGRQQYLADQPRGLVASLFADNSGAVRAGLEYQQGNNFDDNKLILHFKEGETWSAFDIPSKRQNPAFTPFGFSSDNNIAYFLSNYDMPEADTLGLFAYNFSEKSVSLITRHAYADIDDGFYGKDGELLAVGFAASALEYQFVNKSHPDVLLLAGLQQAFPNDIVRITSFDREKGHAVFNVRSDINPGQFFLFNRESNQASYLASTHPQITPELMAPMQPISFTARDGKVIRGFLTLPKDQQKNLPLIVNVHGGPFGIYDRWGFHREAQFFASRGYATLQVNFRGSGGYGDEFQRAGRLEWGKAMQDDVTDATLWAIEQGIAAADRVCIYGGSYGGYAAVWGVIKEPNLYQCSVGYVGVYDMPLFFRGDGSDASRSRTIGQFISSHVGSGDEYMRSISPVHHVDKIQVPLFIVHGSKDVRVPIVHANHLRRELDAAGKEYQWLVKEDGHGFYNVDYRKELYQQMLMFFDKHIGQPQQAAD